MKLVKGYTQWLNENFTEIFEDYEVVNLNLRPNGDFIDPAQYTKYLSGQLAEPFKKFIDEVSKYSSVSNIKVPANYHQIIGSLIQKGQGTNNLPAVFKAGMDKLIAGQIKIGYEKALVDYNYTTNPVNAMTAGKVTNATYITTRDTPQFQKSISQVGSLLSFVNAYNTNAFKIAGGQFILSKRLREDGYLDLISAPVPDPNTLYLYSQQIGKQISTPLPPTVNTDAPGGGTYTGKFDVQFDSGSDVLKPEMLAKVADAVKLCMTQFPAGKIPQKFTLTSGASTEYGVDKAGVKIQMPFSKGVGPVTGTTVENTNQALAYRRGVAFMKALNDGLQAKDHPGFVAYEIAWSIGASGKQANEADRFVDLNIQSNAKGPVLPDPTSNDTAQTVKSVTNTLSKGQFFEFKLTISNS